jgi:hypothetical protein
MSRSRKSAPAARRSNGRRRRPSEGRRQCHRSGGAAPSPRRSGVARPEAPYRLRPTHLRVADVARFAVLHMPPSQRAESRQARLQYGPLGVLLERRSSRRGARRRLWRQGGRSSARDAQPIHVDARKHRLRRAHLTPVQDCSTSERPSSPTVRPRTADGAYRSQVRHLTRRAATRVSDLRSGPDADHEGSGVKLRLRDASVAHAIDRDAVEGDALARRRDAGEVAGMAA